MTHTQIENEIIKMSEDILSERGNGICEAIYDTYFEEDWSDFVYEYNLNENGKSYYFGNEIMSDLRYYYDYRIDITQEQFLKIMENTEHRLIALAFFELHLKGEL
jgi:hypothetical protein